MKNFENVLLIKKIYTQENYDLDELFNFVENALNNS